MTTYELSLAADFRKKEGIFYSPNFITKYIITETIGNYLASAENHFEALQQITVLDLSCGAGAFLIESFDFLFQQYQSYFPDNEGVAKFIIENNLFGVDLDEQAVSICKQQLFERSGFYCDNIKVGNSLIDDKNIAEQPFNWQTEFPQVFKKTLQGSENLVRFGDDGFTIILGNPPYVRQELLGEKQKKYYAKRYANVYHSGADLYVYFYAKALEMLQADGLLAFITPNKWFKTQYGLGLRKLLQSYDIQHIVDFFELKIFADASTEPQIIVLKNAITTKETTNFAYFPVTKALLPDGKIEDFAKNLTKKLSINQGNLNEEEWVFASPKAQIILDKILGKTGVKVISLEEYTNNAIYLGIKTALNKAFIIDKDTKAALIAKDARSAELIKPYAQPTAIKRWEIEDKNESFLINTGFDTEISPENYFAIYEHLQQFDAELAVRQDKGKTHYNLRACDYYDKFEQPKIIYIYTAVNHYFYYDVEGFYVNNSCFIISNADVFLSAFLNSKVFQFYKKLHFVAYGNADEKGRNKLDYNKMVNVPIPFLSETQKQVFIEKVTQILLLNKELKALQSKFSNFLLRNFSNIKISKKITEWHLLSEREFLLELEKQKITIPMKEQYAFFDVFSAEQKNAKSVLSQTQTLENQIDKLIYALYGLSEEEIKIVEM